MFSLSFKPPSAELAYIANVPKGESRAAARRPPSAKLAYIANVPKGELGAAARRPPSAELAYIANVPKGELEAAYSRTPPAEWARPERSIPSTNCFCKKMYMISIGSNDIKHPASIHTR